MRKKTNATKGTATTVTAAPPATSSATTVMTRQTNNNHHNDHGGAGRVNTNKRRTMQQQHKKSKTNTISPLHQPSLKQSSPSSAYYSSSSSPRSQDVRPASSSVQTAPAVLTTSHGIRIKSTSVPSTIRGDVTSSRRTSGTIVGDKFSNNKRATHTKDTTATKTSSKGSSSTRTMKSTILSTTAPLYPPANMVEDASANVSASDSTTISHASAPTANPATSSSSSPSPSSSKKTRHGLTSFFQFRKRRENRQNNKADIHRPTTFFKSKSALLTEFSLLMNEFPAQDALNTTLHVACLKHYSQELIVNQLIAKGPTAVSMRNQSKDLPLHCAMKCRMGIGVENGVYDALVGIYPVGIQAVNGDGCLPIHLACQSGGRNLYVIQKLVQAYPLGLIQRCDLTLPFGVRNNHDVSFRYVSVSNSGSGSGGSNDWDDRSVDNNDKNTSGKKDSEKQERTWGSSFWNALLALSPISTSSSLDQAESNDSANAMVDPGIESSFTPLHLAVMNGAPPDVIEILLDANPMCLNIKTNRGRTPLAIAEFLIAHQGHDDQQHIKKKDDKVIDKGPEDYFENIDHDPIQNVIAAREILKAFQRNQKKSMHLIQAARMASLSIADLNASVSGQEFDSEKAWKKLSHVIKFTKSLQKSSTTSGLGPLIGLDKSEIVVPPNFKLPPNLSHLCVNIDIPVGFRRLRWAMLSSKSTFLTQDVMENKLGFSEIQMSAWDKLDDDIGQTETKVPFDSPASISFLGAQRNCQYIMPKSGLVKANMAYETHTIVEYNDYVFVTRKITKTPEVPFGSSFESHVNTIIVNVGNNQCKMIASVEAKFLDKPPMIAWKIKSAMYSGVTDYFVAKGETICEHAFQESSGGILGD